LLLAGSLVVDSSLGTGVRVAICLTPTCDEFLNKFNVRIGVMSECDCCCTWDLKIELFELVRPCILIKLLVGLLHIVDEALTAASIGTVVVAVEAF
jgi:hypothetical protein